MLIRIKSNDINNDLEGLMKLLFDFKIDEILKISTDFFILEDSILVLNYTSEMMNWFKRFNKNKNYVGIIFPLILSKPSLDEPYFNFFKIVIRNKRLKSQFEKRFCK